MCIAFPQAGTLGEGPTASSNPRSLDTTHDAAPAMLAPRPLLIRSLQTDDLRPSSLQVNCHFRDRHHELPPPIPDIGGLLNDLVFQVPREYQQKIGTGFPDTIW